MRLIQLKAFVFWYGAIAQLGERVLCKHEVVGSIPSGSTRWLIEDRWVASFIPSAKHHFARRIPYGMRVRDFWHRIEEIDPSLDPAKQFAGAIHNLQDVSALDHRKMIEL
jgi:hypothetical protein